MFETPPFWMYVIGFLLVLGPLVTVHELGHYLVGRWFGVRAEAFSIGFGKELFGWTDKRGTRWKVAAIPLGGYVQFAGDMNPASVPDNEALAKASADERKSTFHCKPLWQRALIVFAGPATNLIVTVAIFASFFAVMGKPNIEFPEDSTKVVRFSEVSPARDAGVQVGDKIVEIDGERVDDFLEVTDKIALYPNRTIQLVVERGDQEIALPITIGAFKQTDAFGNEATIGRIGVYRSEEGEISVTYEDVGLFGSIAAAGEHSWSMVQMMVTGIKQILVGDRSLRELGGPIKIAKYSGEQLSLGALPFIEFTALISLNLAFINLLPIPALDGGHLAFYAAEAVRRKPVSPRGMELAYRTGVVAVLMLMVFVTVNDIVSLPIFGS